MWLDEGHRNESKSEELLSTCSASILPYLNDVQRQQMIS